MFSSFDSIICDMRLPDCAGMVALKETLTQLPKDHANARNLAEGTMPFCCCHALPYIMFGVSLQVVQMD